MVESAGDAIPREAATKRFGSFVEFLAITVKAICPGRSSFKPSSRDILLQPGGRMLDIVTIFKGSMPASRNATSNEVKYSLCRPTPLVKNIFVATIILHICHSRQKRELSY